MNIVIGNAARGEDFFDRQQLLANLWDALESDSVLLAAPRRVGKTSVMLRLVDDPRPGFRVVFLDGQDYQTPEDLVIGLVDRVGRLYQDRVDEVELWQLRVKLRQSLAERWRDEGERAIREALPADGKLLIIMDELPVMLHKMISRDEAGGRWLKSCLLREESSSTFSPWRRS